MGANGNPADAEAEKKALQDLAKAEQELLRAEQDIQKAEKELENARHDEVSIFVDGTEHRVKRKKWVVSELKLKLGIDPAKVLAEITPNGLVDLNDGDTIELRDGEKFMTHARSGGSS